MTFKQYHVRGQGIDELYSIEKAERWRWHWQIFHQQRQECQRRKVEDEIVLGRRLVSYNCPLSRCNQYSLLLLGSSLLHPYINKHEHHINRHQLTRWHESVSVWTAFCRHHKHLSWEIERITTMAMTLWEWASVGAVMVDIWWASNELIIGEQGHRWQLWDMLSPEQDSWKVVTVPFRPDQST